MTTATMSLDAELERLVSQARRLAEDCAPYVLRVVPDWGLQVRKLGGRADVRCAATTSVDGERTVAHKLVELRGAMWRIIRIRAILGTTDGPGQMDLIYKAMGFFR